MLKCNFMQSNFIETTLQHGCSPINLLHIFKTSFPKKSCFLVLKTQGFLHFKSFNNGYETRGTFMNIHKAFNKERWSRQYL